MQQKRKNNYIYFAFPGMGKTTYARSHANFLDLDFGNFRSALQVDKSEEKSLLVPFSRLMKYYWKDGFDVLTNEPDLIPLVKQFAQGNMVMVLPRDRLDLARRVVERESNNPRNLAFAKTLSDNVEDWVNDWAKVAQKYSIPVIYELYFKEVPNAL